MKYAVILSLFLASPLWADGAQTLWLHDPATVDLQERAEGVPSSERASQAYARFIAEMTFIGAFAVAPDGGFGWSTGRLTLENARDAALAHCREQARGCVIVAEVAPRGLTDVTGLVASVDLLIRIADLMDKAPHHGLAVAPSGAVGWSFGLPDQASADQRALAYCRENLSGPVTPSTSCRVVRLRMFEPPVGGGEASDL